MSIWESIGSIVRETFPGLFLRGVFRYRVAKHQSGRLVLQPAKRALPDIELSDLGPTEVWPGAAGHSVNPAPGSYVLIAFADQDETLPVVVGFQPLASALGRPVESRFEADTVAIDGDDVELGNAESPPIRDGDDVVIQTEGGIPIPIAAGTIRVVNPTTIFPGKPSPSKVRA